MDARGLGRRRARFVLLLHGKAAQKITRVPRIYGTNSVSSGKQSFPFSFLFIYLKKIVIFQTKLKRALQILNARRRHALGKQKECFVLFFPRVVKTSFSRSFGATGDLSRISEYLLY